MKPCPPCTLKASMKTQDTRTSPTPTSIFPSRSRYLPSRSCMEGSRGPRGRPSIPTEATTVLIPPLLRSTSTQSSNPVNCSTISRRTRAIHREATRSRRTRSTCSLRRPIPESPCRRSTFCVTTRTASAEGRKIMWRGISITTTTGMSSSRKTQYLKDKPRIIPPMRYRN